MCELTLVDTSTYTKCRRNITSIKHILSTNQPSIKLESSRINPELLTLDFRVKTFSLNSEDFFFKGLANQYPKDTG